MATRDIYEMQEWENLPSEETPISAERLAHIEQGIKDAADKRALKEIYDDSGINLGRKAGATDGYHSVAFGADTIAAGSYSYSEGKETTAGGYGSHVEGYRSTSSADYSHAEGYQTQAGTDTMQYSHAEGHGTKAVGYYCHAEGYNTIAGSNSASYAHAEGSGTYATGLGSHAEGEGTTASGSQSHAEGYHTQAQAPYSHSEGIYTIANGQAQHVSGKYNIADMNQYAEIVGGGNSESERINIRTLDWAGNAYFAGNVTNGVGVSLNSLKSAVDSLATVAEGGAIAKAFDTKAELDEWLAMEGNAETLKVGQNIYIAETGTPDYWWDGTRLQVLETEKVEIESMTYEETMAILNATAEGVV